MMFPECSSHFACTQNGQVIYRVCNDSTNPRHRECVNASVCKGCKTRLRMQPEAHVEERKPTPKATERIPSISRRIVTYAEAVIEWTAAGRPERSEEEVERIFKEKCCPCKSFDPDKNVCRRCGCRVAADGFALRNKIKMATQHCPKGYW